MLGNTRFLIWIQIQESEIEHSIGEGILKWSGGLVRGLLDSRDVGEVLIVCDKGAEESLARILGFQNERLRFHGLKMFDALDSKEATRGLSEAYAVWRRKIARCFRRRRPGEEKLRFIRRLVIPLESSIKLLGDIIRWPISRASHFRAGVSTCFREEETRVSKSTLACQGGLHHSQPCLGV